MRRKRQLASVAPLLLRLLQQNGPSTSYDLAQAAGVLPRSVSAAMRKLVREGHARRSPRLNRLTTRTVWEGITSDDESPELKIVQSWLGVDAWASPTNIPRTSVFDTREFTKE